ncbi:MAG: hypothetical protein WAZ99_05325, partial [Rectinemataceae bacterium]
MYRSAAAGTFKSFGKIVVVFLLLLAVAAPAFGQIKSVQARVLKTPDDIVTTRKANFQPGDILGTPLISITIRNGEGAAYLLLKLGIDFGGLWDGDRIQVSLVKKLESNASFTFTNSDMLKYLTLIRSNDFEMEGDIVGHTGVSKIEDIANLKNIPEGTYTISLSASEVELASDDIDSTITKETFLKDASVDFKVVTIGSIGIINLPSFDNLSLTFQVPEIPVYADSTSKTKIVISNGGTTLYTATKNHAKSTAGTSDIKGYPSDTANGYVTYDLGSVPFRAGESYSAAISYIDWNGAEITSKTTSISFPTPKLALGVSLSDPYRPIFSWTLSPAGYSDWVKEYRVYVKSEKENDYKYAGYTSEDTFQLQTPLVPGTAYSWYVMPINKDGTPFFASSSSLVKSLTAKAHTDMTVKVDEPSNNAVLIAGESYSFSGTATFSDGAAERTAVWQIGNENKNGMEISYAPARRYATNSLSAVLKVTDSLGLSKSSPTINLTVLDPAVALQGGAVRTVNKATQVVFAVDSQNTRDIASYEWFLDGSSIGTGSQRAYTFPESGNHEVYATGTTQADINGRTKTVQSPKSTITVVGNGPVASIVQPAAGGELVLGNSVKIVSRIENENALRSVTWSVIGPDASQNGRTGNEFTFTPGAAGTYTVTVTALDVQQKQAQASTRILVIDPAITVTSPTQNAVFALTSVLSPVISAPNADRIVWYIDGDEIGASSYALSQLGAGSHELYATAFWNAIDGNGGPIEYSENSPTIAFSVRDLTPPAIAIRFPQNSMVLKTGETYRFEADLGAASNIGDSWWEIDGARLPSDTYTPPTTLSNKLLSVSYNAKNSDGIKGTKSVSVRVVNPAVYLSAPVAGEYRVGTVVPVNASAVDADLYWVVDGSEAANWNKIFTSQGIHTVQAGWRVRAVDGSGGDREFTGQSKTIQLSIYSDRPPVITGFSPV